MKRKIFSALMILIIFAISVSAQTVTLYAPDGSSITVPEEERENYKGVGWYETFEEVTSVLYAPDGRRILVYNIEVPAYKELGWYETYEEVTSTLYAPDGRSMVVYNSEVPTYLKLGWYASYEEVTSTLYAPDGRTMVVYNSEVPTYLKLGWYKTYDEVTTTLYSADGREMVVYDSEVDTYLKLGWKLSRRGVDSSKPMVAITYDDGPSSYTSSILGVFEKYGGGATFFVVGKNAAAYPSLIKKEYDLGMEIANHTYSHPNLTSLSSAQISSQVSSTDSAVFNACGKYPVLLRPPYGSYNSSVKSSVGKPLILWSIDTRDWESRNADKVYANVINNVRDGDIILMHDLYKSTADATARIVPALIERGFQLVTVSELAKYKGVTLNSGSSYGSIR